MTASRTKRPSGWLMARVKRAKEDYNVWPSWMKRIARPTVCEPDTKADARSDVSLQRARELEYRRPKSDLIVMIVTKRVKWLAAQDIKRPSEVKEGDSDGGYGQNISTEHQ